MLSLDNGKSKKNWQPDARVDAKVTTDVHSIKPENGRTSQELKLITKKTRLFP